MKTNKKIILAGGTDWSVEFLNLLHKEGFNIIGVLAPPDSKKNRGQKVNIPALKVEAKKLHIPILQPQKLSDLDFLRKFKKLEPSVVVVVAYGKLFPKEILKIPPLGFINFHPSLLPKLRGPSPIQSAILEGHEETGVSIMKLGEGMDDGPILAQKKMKINPRETSETLTRKLIALGKKMLPDILKKYPIEGQTQDDTQATYCKIIRKEDGHIDWQKETAKQIDRKIRALNPQIKTFTFLEKNNQKKRVNILKTTGIIVGPQRAVAEFPEEAQTLQYGQYKLLEKNLAVDTKKGILLVSKLQIEGKKPISAEEFIRGYGKGLFV